MLLTITYSGQNTIDLGYLLFKNPYRPQMFELSYGNWNGLYVPNLCTGYTSVSLVCWQWKASLLTQDYKCLQTIANLL